MSTYSLRIIRLVFGLFLFSLGVVLDYRSGLGLPPWDVFHQGISLHTVFSIGVANIVVSLILVVLCWSMREAIGIGMLFNMILVGVFLDGLLIVDIVPHAGNFLGALVMLVSGVFSIAFGSYFYISAAFGAGPRDSLMVLLVRRTGLSVALVRVAIEGSAFVAGWLLGGFAGLGTALTAAGTGIAIGVVFRLMHFDVKNLQHETVTETWKHLKGSFS